MITKYHLALGFDPVGDGELAWTVHAVVSGGQVNLLSWTSVHLFPK
jgi:hypothetical protein